MGASSDEREDQMRIRVIAAAAGLLGAIIVPGMASATIVAKIGAGYETSCQADGTCYNAVQGGAGFNGNLSGTDPTFTVYDDPSIFIYNTTAFNFTNVSIQGLGYQGANNGILQSPANGVPSTIAANSVFQFSWNDYPGFASCGQGAGNLFAYDYDDTYGCSGSAQPGNVKILFNAVWNGQNISALFSPNNNLTGGFVGFQGLDPNGFAETSYDNHSPGVGAYVANIVVGQQTFGTPEPATWALMLVGFGGLGSVLRGHRRRAAAV
jgi:hypothetical protein